MQASSYRISDVPCGFSRTWWAGKKGGTSGVSRLQGKGHRILKKTPLTHPALVQYGGGTKKQGEPEEAERGNTGTRGGCPRGRAVPGREPRAVPPRRPAHRARRARRPPRWARRGCCGRGLEGWDRGRGGRVPSPLAGRRCRPARRAQLSARRVRGGLGVPRGSAPPCAPAAAGLLQRFLSMQNEPQAPQQAARFSFAVDEVACRSRLGLMGCPGGAGLPGHRHPPLPALSLARARLPQPLSTAHLLRSSRVLCHSGVGDP
ncbi:uncharacterized protein LOC131490779 [Neofelis nebulosa]|uniref:uncharacterized protein LOC131490779 n=1 Tax=Neofelis nebulosa TaxID=61452 RepID=UPI00272B16D3|nr:uncharacterized protein LOC131490779 [Neofelis nebulosa]